MGTWLSPYILLSITIVAGLGQSLRHAMITVAIVGFSLSTRLVRSPSGHAAPLGRMLYGAHANPATGGPLRAGHALVGSVDDGTLEPAVAE